VAEELEVNVAELRSLDAQQVEDVLTFKRLRRRHQQTQAPVVQTGD